MPKSTGGRKRQYTDEQRAIAVTYAEAAGYPHDKSALLRAARATGVPYNSLKSWARIGIKRGNPDTAVEVERIMDKARTDLRTLIDGEVQNIFENMQVKREDATYRDLTVAAGILIDKLQLLNDKPTQNVQQAITFERRGISTLSESTAPVSTPGTTGSETV